MTGDDGHADGRSEDASGVAETAVDAPADGHVEPEDATPPDVDTERRAFFKSFGRQALTTVGQVAGMADIVSRTGSSAAAELLGLGTANAPPAPLPGQRGRRRTLATRRTVTTGAGVEDTHRSAYRLEEDLLVLLDQRSIPEALEELVCRRGSDVAYHLRTGAVRGGPVMAQVAAYGLALTARERQDKPAETRDIEIRRTRDALTAARPSSRLLAWAMERMERVAERLPDDTDGAEVATAHRAEADAIASRLQTDHAAITAALVSTLPEPSGRPLGVLVHGAPGALAGGLFGTVLPALAELHEVGRGLRIHLTETRPFMEGARLAAWELRQAGVPHRIVADAAVAWLFANEPIDVVLLAPERVAIDGATTALVGSRAIALQLLALRQRHEADVPDLLVCGSSAAIDPTVADESGLPPEARPTRELDEYLDGVPIGASVALVPAVDVVPADAVDGLITERGLVEPTDRAAMDELASTARTS